MSQIIRVKSISKLSQVDSIQQEDLFWLSRQSGVKYSSYSVPFDLIVQAAEDVISTDIRDQYNLSGVNVGNLNLSVNNLYYSNVTLDGIKTMTSIPILGGDYANNPTTIKDGMDKAGDNAFATCGYVRTLITDSCSFIGDTSIINVDPDNDSRTTKEEFNNDYMMIWRIADGQRDSTLFKDEYNQTNEGVICPASGQLVVYGWLADSGTVLPQEAWVALYGQVQVGESQYKSSKWTILQVQPWPKTDNSRKLQYVGFNIPVKKGLALKIKTGFQVDASATATNEYNTLTFPNVMPNTFVGYIIEEG